MEGATSVNVPTFIRIPSGSFSYWWRLLFFMAAAFFVVAALLMVTWNYALPRIVRSIDNTYERSTYTNIDYTVAMAFTILLGLIWGAGSVRVISRLASTGVIA